MFLEEWEKSLLYDLLLKRSLGTSQVKEVEFDNLQNDLKGALRQIFEFLQLEYTDQRLSDGAVANLLDPDVNR